MQKQIIGSFIWERGSINDNIRNILSSKHIPYYNTFNGDVFALFGDYKKIYVENNGRDRYNAYINA